MARGAVVMTPSVRGFFPRLSQRLKLWNDPGVRQETNKYLLFRKASFSWEPG